MTQNEIHGVRPSSPRILPLPSGERDAESRLLIASIGSSATGNTFDTLIRHPDLLRQWMPFTLALAVTGCSRPVFGRSPSSAPAGCAEQRTNWDRTPSWRAT